MNPSTTEAHFNTDPTWPQTKEQVDQAPADILDDFMERCDVEPADFENCLACYAYKVVQDREAVADRHNDLIAAVWRLMDTASSPGDVRDQVEQAIDTWEPQ